jgi:hypothetical protein
MEDILRRLDLGITSTGFVFSSDDLVACYWRTREGNFAITCFTPEGDRVWQMRGLKFEDARTITSGYNEWLQPAAAEL